MAKNDHDHEAETYGDEVSRSIFSALWFRALVVVLVLGVVAAVAVPYVLDFVMTPSPKLGAIVKAPPSTPAQPQPSAQVPPASPPATVPVTPQPAVRPEPSGAPKAEPRPAQAKPELAQKPAAKPSQPAGVGETPKATETARSLEMPKPSEAPKVGEAPKVPEAPKAAEAPKVAQASKAAQAPKVADAPKPAEPPRLAEASKPEEAPKIPEAPKPTKSPKPSETTKIAATPPAGRSTPAPRPAATTAAGGPYWVQVGAFKDEATAKRVADKLRGQNFPVEQSDRPNGGAASPATTGGGNRYNVFVSGLEPAELNSRLAGKGLTAQPVSGGAVIMPSMPLPDAVSLSRDLAVEGGLKIQVRRVTTQAAGASPSASPATGGTLHRVRVGAFADRAAADAAARELEAKGFKVFIARGNQ